MIAVNAATNAATGHGQATELRHGLLARWARRYRDHAARTRADWLARTAWTEDARPEPADPAQGSRDRGATPLRWVRLT